jgi:hypothetical protein
MLQNAIIYFLFSFLRNVADSVNEFVLLRVSVTKTLIWIGVSVYRIFTSRNCQSYCNYRTWSLQYVNSSQRKPHNSVPGRLHVLDSWLFSYDWLQTIFAVHYEPSARIPWRTPIIVDVFTVLLLGIGNSAHHSENEARDSNHEVHWRADCCPATSYKHSSYCACA